MPILGDATTVTARLTKSASNALRIQLATADGTELGRAQQKGGAAVLFGFKNGGKSDYTLSSTAGDELQIAVAGTTTITRQNSPVGRIVPADGAAKLEDGAGTVLAVVQPHSGFKADRAWHHRILSPAGDELGVLTLITVHTGWHDIDSEAMQLLFDYNVNAQKLPSAGALLRLRAPVAPELGDVMAAACVDFSVLPRGYVA
jgi:antitoxin (DNA-binding transcriptional repressor) of toxin-antitoxin stability system